MTRTCVVQQCRLHRNLNKTTRRYFAFPPTSEIIHTNRLNAERREKWLQALRLEPDFTWRHKAVCEDHFVSGRPAKNTDKNNVDWVPTLNLPGSEEIRDSSDSDDEKPTSFADLEAASASSESTGQNAQLPADDEWVDPQESSSDSGGNVTFDKDCKVELGDTILDGTDEDRCEFCLKLPEEEDQIVVPLTGEPTIRGTIEFVLGVSVGSPVTAATLNCCLSCWGTFESYYNFKTNCLASMKTRRKILADLKPELEVEQRPSAVYSGSTFRCQRCFEQCSSQVELVEHMTRYCFESEEDDDLVEEMVKKPEMEVEFVEHPADDDDDEAVKEDRTQNRIFPKNFIFCCPRCKSVFNQLVLLQDHKEKCTVPRRIEQPEMGVQNEQGVIVYGCKLCKCTYNSARLLQFHMNKHYDTPEWICRKGCNRTFYFPSNRIRHEKNCYGRNRVTARLPEPVGKKRKRCTDEKPRKKKFDYPAGFVWCCSGCKAQFSGLGVLNKHKKICGAWNANKDLPPRTDEVVEQDSAGMYRCLLCTNSSYKTASLYSFHMNRHYDERKFECRIREGCPRAFFNPALRNIHEKDCQKDCGYVCTICGEMLKSRDTLRRHMEAHGQRKWECMICGKKFKTRNCFKGHWARHWSGADPVASAESNLANVENLPRNIICELCQTGLPSHGIYARHRRYCNQPESPPPENRLQCPECPKSFVSQERFQEHRNRHAGIRAVSCRSEGCTAKFYSVHTRNTHEINCGKQWVCSECGLVFQQKNSLSQHMETHGENPPTCEICNKRFSSKTALGVHAVTHTKEKNYACPICDRRFTQNSSVKTHLKTHSDEEKQGLDPNVHVFLAKEG
uniref:Zinc finger protein 845 n=1 Tax=Culex pipiens TaxID=7175 RepID=A0A8D8ET57_CULPI